MNHFISCSDNPSNSFIFPVSPSIRPTCAFALCVLTNWCSFTSVRRYGVVLSGWHQFLLHTGPFVRFSVICGIRTILCQGWAFPIISLHLFSRRISRKETYNNESRIMRVQTIQQINKLLEVLRFRNNGWIRVIFPRSRCNLSSALWFPRYEVGSREWWGPVSGEVQGVVGSNECLGGEWWGVE